MEPHLAQDAILHGFFSAIQSSWLGDVARRSPWLYPASNILHVLGAALVLGGIAVLDLALLRRKPEAVAAIARIAIPLAAFGLLLQIATGLVLFSAEAAALAGNPAFLFKMALILLGLANIAWFHLRLRSLLPSREAMPAGAAWHGGVSLVTWILVLASGRAIAYL